MNDEAYTLHLDYIPKTKSTFKKGNIPWNKGLSWEKQGWTEERKEKVLAQLKVNMSKNKYENTTEHLKTLVRIKRGCGKETWHHWSQHTKGLRRRKKFLWWFPLALGREI